MSSIPMSFGRVCWLVGVALLVSGPLFAKDKAEKSEKWSVDESPGPWKRIDIDVRTGTWISVDVHPSGEKLVFDLLGDLYELPIDGGKAKSLTSGRAWDMQPRYSPDGRQIAFTSDRGGGDNIWVARSDGRKPVAVTDESFRLLNSPDWTPDGEYLVARKHFTSTRSLGGGELWLYHLSGGAGVKLVDKPSEQKDLGEPAPSADGRYIWYSQDVTSGPRFEYSRNPHEGIYAIKRLDRDTGETKTVVRGLGGAVRPTPSPAGDKLAFVRRVEDKTALFVRDLRSGAEVLLDDQLDRDFQETWAIHGVYASMSWTPGGESVVYWAKGQIRRAFVATGEVRAIPFRVVDTREVADAVTRKTPLDEDTFEVKMLRSAAVSPDGSAVVFEALGQLWLRALPTGRPKRLTNTTDRFELQPTWTPDSKSIVFVTWDDDELGSLQLVAAKAGATPRTLTTQPGHYVEPAVSPDGRTVVVRRSTGGWLRSPLWGEEPGIYVLPIEGGEARLVSAKGKEPHYGPDSDRIYFLGRGKKNALTLESIGIHGEEPRTHLSNGKADSFRVSPDGQWVAFRERSHLVLAPFPKSGRSRGVSRKDKSLPHRVVARDSGWWLHFSGDSSTLYWTQGPELFSADVRDFVPAKLATGDKDERAKPKKTGRSIGLTAEMSQGRGVVAFVGGTALTMKGDERIEDATVLVDGSRIVAVGRRADVDVPDGATVYDVAGHTVLPGFIDVHAHGAQATSGIVPERNWGLEGLLAFGVTTIHDPSNSTTAIFAASELQKVGRIPGPRIFSTGRILYGAETWFMAEVDSVDDALSHLRRLSAVGAFSVKSYNQPRRDQRQQVLQAARELDMLVVPEGGSLLQHNLTMIVDGHSGIEHALPVAAVYEDIEQLWGQTTVGYTPTLGVAYGGIFGENYWYQESDVYAHERLRRFCPPFALQARARRRMVAPPGEWNHQAAAAGAAQLASKGVRVHVGAHGQREGLAAHWEIWSLAEAGMPAIEALRVATINGATYLGLQESLGSLEPGKRADLAIVQGDPLADIRVTENVAYTVVDGVVYDASTTNQLHPQAVERPAPFWMLEGSAPWQGDPQHELEHGRCHGCGVH